MWTSFFEGIEYLFVEILMKPMDWLAKLELSNWWLANFITFAFIIICCVAFVYWLKQLNIFAKNNEDDQDTTAHSFLK
ncbi:MAG TPA: hypothetical protein VKY32_09940 [Flavobacterium sp.]|nr:hypothetical protein [Flavobacterium sp.]HLW41500.1 hypothetical protein [Flavobacterium sp.]